jgi:hypothetical protein
MLSCPRKTSREWQDVLARANGNEDEARRIWIEEEFEFNPDLNIEVNDDNYEDEREGEPGQEELEPNDDFSKLIQRIKIYINKQIEILNSKKIANVKYKQSKLNELLNAVETMDGVASINVFIKDAYDKAKQVQTRFAKLLVNKNKMSSKEIMIELTGINDFANSYSILDEIDSADIMNYFSTSDTEEGAIGPMTPQKMLAEAIKIRDKVKKKVVTEAIPLMAEYLVEYKSTLQDKTIPEEIARMEQQIKDIEANPKMSDKRKEKEIKKLEDRLKLFEGFDIDQGSMEQILKMANRDEGVIDFLISPLITSSDSALALFAKSIKSQLEFARQKDIKVRDRLVSAFEKYRNTAPASSDNTAKFNEGIYDEVEIPVYEKDGTISGTRKELQFVQKFNMGEFNKAKKEFFDKLGPMPQKVGEKATKEEAAKIKAWWEARNKWYADNTQPRPKAERDAIILQMQKDRDNKLISEDDYNNWLRKNVREYKGAVSYFDDLATPSNKYKSDKWNAMYDSNDVPKNEKGRYHEELLKIYFEAQAKLPESQQKGFRLPSISKSDLERIMQNGLKDFVTTNLKEAVKVQSWDTEFGLGSLSEEDVKFLPIYYTQQMDVKDVTLDLAMSVLVFSAMANKYEAMNNVNAEISLMKTIVGARKVPETNSKGQAVLDAFAKKLGYEEYIRQNGESYSKKHLDAFIDMVIYGEMQKAEEIFGGLSLTKITNSAMSYSAITTIAADLLKGVANNLQGNIQVLIEAAGGQFFNRKNLRRGKAFLAKNLPSVLADFGKPAPTSLLGKLVEKFDPMQGNFKDNYGKKVSMSRLNKLMRTDTLFFNQHFGEYEIQVSTMLALFDNIKVLDKATGEEITLLQAYNTYGADEAHSKIKIAKTNSKGEVETDDQGNTVYIPFGETQRQDIQARLHGLNKYMHGVYNDFDKGTLQKYSLGRLVLMYRKHVVPGYKRRFKRVSMDHEIGTPTEGYYRTFADTMLSDIKQYKFNIIKNWSTYTPFQKAQIAKVLTELTIILSLATLAFVLTRLLVNPDDDERDPIQDNFGYNFLLYETLRMRSETASYINPIDAIRVMRSPSAMTSTIDRVIKFMNQVMPWNITEEYKRETGIWNKGDNKAWAAFIKLMGFSGYNTNPEQAWKSFESSFFK